MPATLPHVRARSPLRVAVLFSAPWAFADGLSLDGVEVREVRRYALWRGREVNWTNLGAQDLPLALAEGCVDLAIGGLLATPALEAAARLARFSEHSLDAADGPHSRRSGHVWAVGQDWLEWAAVNAYLKVVRHRSVASSVPAGHVGSLGVQSPGNGLLNGKF